MRGVAGLACGALGLALAGLTRSLSSRDAALAGEVARATAELEIAHEVTAVLLEFRGYDTLLEVAVLLLALTAAWALVVRAPEPTPRADAGAGAGGGREDLDPSGLLDGLVDVVAPAALLTAAYFGWAGMRAPGGAFQAGAVLAAAGVLLILAHRIDARRLFAPGSRLAACAGLWIFLAIALGTMAAGRAFLALPPEGGKFLLSLIEASLTISIAAILATLFAGAYGAGDDQT
jgi:multisubunit Na+/H+ antiporter MnhB subunit